MRLDCRRNIARINAINIIYGVRAGLTPTPVIAVARATRAPIFYTRRETIALLLDEMFTRSIKYI